MSETVRALVLSAGDERYAVELDAVREVVEEPSLVRVPTASPHVRGLFNMRGELVAALDLSVLLGRGGGDGGPAGWWAVLHADGGACALAGTGAPRTVELGDAAAAGASPHVRGRYIAGDEAIALLDLPSLLEGAVRS